MTKTVMEDTFRKCLEAHQGLLWRVARSFASKAEDQQDLLQEMFLQLWTSLPAFRGDSKESTWIYRLAFNTALVWQRKEKRRRLKHEAFSVLAGMDESTSGRPGDDELLEQLYAAVRELPKLDASLALMHLDGLSYREMGDVLGLSESHVGVKLHRIRKQLTQQLRGQDDEL